MLRNPSISYATTNPRSMASIFIFYNPYIFWPFSMRRLTSGEKVGRSAERGRMSGADWFLDESAPRRGCSGGRQSGLSEAGKRHEHVRDRNVVRFFIVVRPQASNEPVKKKLLDRGYLYCT